MMTLVLWKGCAQDSLWSALNTAESRKRRDTRSPSQTDQNGSFFCCIPIFNTSSTKVSPGLLRTAFTHSRWTDLDALLVSPVTPGPRNNVHSHRCDDVGPAKWGDEWLDPLRVLLKQKINMESSYLQQRAAQRAKMSFNWQSWMILLLVFANIPAVPTQGKRVTKFFISSI